MRRQSIAPAMTTEEWAKRQVWQDRWGGVYVDSSGDLVALDAYHEGSVVLPRHKVAALALHGQPFGFTRQDVEVLQRVAFILGATADAHEDSASGNAAAVPRLRGDEEAVLSLAARIQALLPPEDTSR